MDDFFNTINVRDLLSTPDIDDPSSQLSAPDLRLLIDRLDSHSHHIKSKVQSYILSNRANFSDLLSLSSSSFSQSLSLSSNLQSLISILSPDDDCFSQIESVLKEIRIGVSDLEVTKNELSILKVIVRLSERLRELKELIRVGDFVVAAKGIRALKGELRIGSVDEERENEKIFVYGLLRKELMNSFEEVNS